MRVLTLARRRWVMGTGLVLAALMGPAAHGGLIKASGSASTSNKGGYTAGQTQILATVDPYNVVKFQLDYEFEADKVSFASITGVNGYVIDSYTVITDGSFGLISDIRGHYPGFESAPEPIEITSEELPQGAEPGAFPPSPAGEVDMFALLFNDLAPTQTKTFNVFAGGPDDFMTGFDPDTQSFTIAQGPANVVNAVLVVPGINGPGGAGGAAAPLPVAVWMGLGAGAAVVARGRRRHA